MSVDYLSERAKGRRAGLQRALTLTYTLVLSAMATLEPIVAAIFEINPVRQGAMLGLLIFLYDVDASEAAAEP